MKIAFMRHERDCGHNVKVKAGIYKTRLIIDWRIEVDGVPRGFWKRNGERDGYVLADIDGYPLKVAGADGKEHPIRLPSQKEMRGCAVEALRRLPDEKALEARRAERHAGVGELNRAAAEIQRREQIASAANDMYAACKAALARLAKEGRSSDNSKACAILQHAVDVAEGRAQAKEPAL
jgi:hypothetical protein